MSTPPSEDELLLIGRVAGSFGIRGQLKVVALTANIDHIQRKARTIYLGPRQTEHRLISVLEHKPGLLIMTIDRVTSREAADELRGSDVSIRETDAAPLEEGEYFLHSLYGLKVLTDTGEEIGQVREVIETGANDVLVVSRPEGGEALIPVIQDVVRELDVEGGRIVIHPIPGLLE
jgi:16S rRNA processing protein RimM